MTCGYGPENEREDGRLGGRHLLVYEIELPVVVVGFGVSWGGSGFCWRIGMIGMGW